MSDGVDGGSSGAAADVSGAASGGAAADVSRGASGATSGGAGDVVGVGPAVADAASGATSGDAAAAAATAGWTAHAIVVGGGIAGLVAARDLAVRGLRPLVLEGWAAPGGAVGRHVVAGLELDAGADSFATRDGIVAALATELGLAGSIEAPSGRGAWVQLPTGAGTLPRTGILGIPAHPWARDVRGTIGLLGALRASADRLLPAAYGTLTSDGTPASLGALVASRMGRRVLDRLVMPIVSGVHAADPNELDVDSVAPGLRAALAAHGTLGAAVASMRASAPAGAAVAGLTGGMHTIIDALVTDLEARGGRLETRARVTTIDRTTAGGAVEWSVTVAGAPGTAGTPGTPERVLTTGLLVLALPGPAAADLLAPLVPGLAQTRPETGADVVLATLVLDAPALDTAPRGTGVLVAPGVVGIRAKALTHATAKWGWLAAAAGPGRHVVRLSYGQAAGPRITSPRHADRAEHDPAAPGIAAPGIAARDISVRDIAGLSLADLTAVALRDASALLGVDLDGSQVVGSARVRWSQSLPKPSPAHRAAVAAARAGAATLPGLAVCGSWVAGNGLAAVVAQARAAVATEARAAVSATPVRPGAGNP